VLIETVERNENFGIGKGTIAATDRVTIIECGDKLVARFFDSFEVTRCDMASDSDDGIFLHFSL